MSDYLPCSKCGHAVHPWGRCRAVVPLKKSEVDPGFPIAAKFCNCTHVESLPQRDGEKPETD